MRATGLITERQLAGFAAALESRGWRKEDFHLQEDVFDPRKAEVEAALGEVGVRCLRTEAVEVYRLGQGLDWVRDFARDLDGGKFGRQRPSYLDLYQTFDPPYERFDNAMLGPDFAAELDLVSRLWFRCGYRPGITAYLNFFLLRDFITTHDTSFPPRFKSLRSMADSFYQTDLFIREVTDSGAKPSGGISSRRVREQLKGIQKRHAKIGIPPWMQTYFGFSLLENVEKQCAPLSEEDRRRHLAYMAKAYRIMGFGFSQNRADLERFARLIEQEQASVTERVPAHSRHILRIGEMIGVSSGPESVLPMLPAATRALFEPLYSKVRPGPAQRLWSRFLGRLLLPKAVGEPRRAVPVEG